MATWGSLQKQLLGYIAQLNSRNKHVYSGK